MLKYGERSAERARRSEVEMYDHVPQNGFQSLLEAARARGIDLVGLFEDTQWRPCPPFWE